MIEDSRDIPRLIALLGMHESAGEALAEAEWQSLAQFALRQGVGQILYARLRQRRAAVPPAVALQLRRAYLANAARNIRLFHELGHMLRAFRARGTPVIPLKGACLAEAVYGDVALRPMADIDLLVRVADLDRAVHALRALGYESDRPFDPIATWAGVQDLPPMQMPGRAPVELHWTLVIPGCNANFHGRELEGLWSRAMTMAVAGVETPVLSPTDLLLHLCMHVSVHHRFNDVSVRNFVDIAKVCRHYDSEIDWADVVARANEWRVATGVRMALELAGEWTDLSIPSDALARLAGDPVDDELMTWARHKVLDGTPASLNSDIGRLEGGAGMTGRLGVLRNALFRPRAAMARDYAAEAGSWRILSYYPIRWKTLWGRYRSVLWKLAKRDKHFLADARKEARLREYLGWR